MKKSNQAVVFKSNDKSQASHSWSSNSNDCNIMAENYTDMYMQAPV